MMGAIGAGALVPATALLAVALSGCGGSRHGQDFERAGIRVRVPQGWRLTTRNDSFVSNPALCFAILGSGVEVKLVEYLPPYLTADARRFYRPRPRHFRLSMLRRGDNDWTAGKTLAFQEHGRVFYVGMAGRTDRRAEQLLDSLRIGSGRCRPTAGVGS